MVTILLQFESFYFAYFIFLKLIQVYVKIEYF